MRASSVGRILLAGLLSASVGGAVAGDLHRLAKAAGKLYFGTAVDNGELGDAAYKAIISDAADYGQITPGNTQKWQFTEASPGAFSFKQGDVIADFAKANGQIMRCHTLVWHSQLPSWVSSGSWTKQTLTGVINTHIENEVGHYKGACYAWDVVNEALNDDGTYRDSVFHKVLGTDFLPIAFKAAAAADPAAKLYYNDYSIEHGGPKQKAAVKIVDVVRAGGARIDGVGLQGHFVVGSTPPRADLAAVLAEFAAKGVEVAYTEIDVRFQKLPASAGDAARQATDYGNIVGACLDVEACVGITVWGASDKHSWIPSTFPGQGDACLLTADMKTKPAYARVREVLAAAAGGNGGGGAAPTSSSAGARPPPATTSGVASSRRATTSPPPAAQPTSPSPAPTDAASSSSSSNQPAKTKTRCPAAGRRRRRAARTPGLDH